MSTKKYKRGDDVRLSANFHLREFECKCSYSDCVNTLVNMDHITKLQKLREDLGKPTKIAWGKQEDL